MSIGFCKRCGRVVYDGRDCRCKEFKIINENGEECSSFGVDEEDAAENYAKESNECNEYYLMDTTVEIMVGDKKFSIGAEPDIHYNVREIE